jgi:hypothetical protein
MPTRILLESTPVVGERNGVRGHLVPRMEIVEEIKRKQL